MAQRRQPTKAEYDIDFARLHLSVRWDTVLMPFEQSKLLSLLPNEGYVLDESLRRLAPFGAWQEASGPIARKGETTLIMNSDSLVLGIEARDENALVDEFNAIEEFLRQRLLFDSPRHALHYEFLAQMLAWTELNAIEVLRRLDLGNAVVSRISETLGIGPAHNLSLRITPADGVVHSANWWDFHIEPSFRSPQHCYRLAVVYRNAERQRVVDFAKGITDTIRNTLHLLERTNE